MDILWSNKNACIVRKTQRAVLGCRQETRLQNTKKQRVFGEGHVVRSFDNMTFEERPCWWLTGQKYIALTMYKWRNWHLKHQSVSCKSDWYGLLWQLNSHSNPHQAVCLSAGQAHHKHLAHTLTLQSVSQGSQVTPTIFLLSSYHLPFFIPFTTFFWPIGSLLLQRFFPPSPGGPKPLNTVSLASSVTGFHALGWSLESQIWILIHI